MQQAEVRTLTPATNPRPGRSDVVIHCDHQRIDSSTPDQFGNPFDPTQGRYIAKDGLINSRECRQGTGDGDMSTRAVVSKPGAIMDLEPPSTHHDDYDAKGFQPEVLQLCADTMRFIRDPTKNHYLLSKDIIEQAVADGRNKDESTDEVRGIDLLPTLEHVLLHEVCLLFIESCNYLDNSSPRQRRLTDTQFSFSPVLPPHPSGLHHRQGGRRGSRVGRLLRLDAGGSVQEPAPCRHDSLHRAHGRAALQRHLGPKLLGHRKGYHRHHPGAATAAAGAAGQAGRLACLRCIPTPGKY